MGGRESALDRVRAIAKRELAPLHFDLDVPGYGGLLVLRFAPMGWDDVDSVGESHRGPSNAARHAGATSSRRDWNILADIVIRGVSDVMVRDGADLVPLRESGPTRITRELGEVLEWPEVPARARGILLTLFGRANAPDLAVTKAAVAYQEWLEAADADIAEAVAGE